MIHQADPNLANAVNLRRVQLLYGKLPSAIVSALLGVFVVFALLLRVSDVDSIKAWATYMLSTLALSGYLWYAFSSRIAHAADVRRWETAFALCALLGGLGWGALNGPLYPLSHHEVHDVFFLVTLVISFSAAVYFGLSNQAFWAMVIPTLLPAVWRFSLDNADTRYVAALAGILGAAMVVAVQVSVRRTLLDNLRRGVESEALLAEQQAIFQSATLGIAVMQDSRIVKANPRLADLLGRPLAMLPELGLESHFADADEFEQMLRESDEAFRNARSFHDTYRLKRGDGSQFWAEFSGRRMDGAGPQRNVWLIAEAPLRPAAGMSGER